MENCRPVEIIVHESVKDDPVTIYFLGQCPGVKVKYVSNGIPKEIVKTSEVLSQAKGGLLDKILLGKQVVYIAPAADVLDVFTMPDDRMVCPHFERMKLASNGCFYRCEWCYGPFQISTPFSRPGQPNSKILPKRERRGKGAVGGDKGKKEMCALGCC